MCRNFGYIFRMPVDLIRPWGLDSENESVWGKPRRVYDSIFINLTGFGNLHLFSGAFSPESLVSIRCAIMAVGETL